MTAHTEYLVLTDGDGQPGWFPAGTHYAEHDALQAASREAESRYSYDDCVLVARLVASVSRRDGETERIGHSRRLWPCSDEGHHGGSIDVVHPRTAGGLYHAEARLLLPLAVGERLAAHLADRDAGEVLAAMLDRWEEVAGVPAAEEAEVAS